MAAKKSVGYDKVLLGLGILVALGLITMVGLKAGSVMEAFETREGRKLDALAIPEEGQVKGAIASLGEPKSWTQAETPKGRKVDLLTGIPYYIKKDGGESVDLLDPDGAEVHQGMDNIWWYTHGLDVGWSDSPERDADIDGFTNREEYDGKTDPNDPKSFPSLIDKVELVKLEAKPFKVTFSSDAGETYRFTYLDAFLGRRREERSPYLKIGEVFFPKGPATLRYRLKSVEEREILIESTGTRKMVKVATIEDLLPTKNGDTFEVTKGSSTAVIRRDYSVILTLNAAGAQGQDFTVEERESFSLPHDPAAAVKPYTFKEVLEDKSTVIIAHEVGGETKLYKIAQDGRIEAYTP